MTDHLRLPSRYGNALDNRLMRQRLKVRCLPGAISNLRPAWMPGKITDVPLATDQRRDLLRLQRQEAQTRIWSLLSIHQRVIALLLSPLILFCWFVRAGKSDLSPSRRPGKVVDTFFMCGRSERPRLPPVEGDEIELRC